MKLYGGIDLHSNNNVVALLDEDDHAVYRASVIVPASASARRTEVRLTQLPAKAGVPSAGRNDDQGRVSQAATQ